MAVLVWSACCWTTEATPAVLRKREPPISLMDRDVDDDDEDGEVVVANDEDATRQDVLAPTMGRVAKAVAE